MDRRDHNSIVEEFEKKIRQCVEEIDESYFSYGEYHIKLTEFVDKKTDMVIFDVNAVLDDSAEEVKKTIVLYRMIKDIKNDSKGAIEWLSNTINEQPLLSGQKVQLIGVVEGLDKRSTLENFWRENKAEIYKKIGVNTRTAEVDVIFVPTFDNQPIEIGVTRMNSIIFPDPNLNFNIKAGTDENKSDIKGYVFVVKLSELVDIYNRVGEELFSSNLRYGIADQLSLEDSMRQTLLEEPNMFWFYNNGVTIVTDKSSNINLENPVKITLLDSWNTKKLSFSVINGAQTVSTASRIFGDNSINKSELDYAKENAKVLLRVITANKPTTKRNITIALNRQKPIKAEDIAFQTPFVSKYNLYMGDRESENISYLYIIKRGEDNLLNTIELPLFAQLVYSCFLHPTEARNSGPSKLYMDSADANDLKDEFFKNSFSQEENAMNLKEIYEKYYQEIIWAYNLYKRYNLTIKTFKDDDEKAILANNKWSFVSYVLLCMQNSEKIDGKYNIDYSKFKENSQILRNIKMYMEEFIDSVREAYGDRKEGYTVETSKTKEFWERLCTIKKHKLFEDLYTEDLDAKISKGDFIAKLMENGFSKDDDAEKYYLSVDSVACGGLYIEIKSDETFDISTELYSPFNIDSDMSNEELDSSYSNYVDDAIASFSKRVGMEPGINTWSLGTYDDSLELGYYNIDFDYKFVELFIEAMLEIY